MKKFLLLIATVLTCSAIFAQFNYSFTNARVGTGIYSDISTTGASIDMTDAESGNSTSPINIGFNFNFNGNIFTQCMIHADGILRFGATAPGSHPTLFTNNASTSSSVYTTTDAAYQNVVLALFMDLVQGSATPAYHSITEGVAPNRVTTIQWKNLKDNNNPGATTQSQFNNLEFQVKLYETSNDIQVIYGNFIPSANTVAGRFAQAGIKVSSTLFIGVQKGNSINAFGISEFIDPAAHTFYNAGLPIRKTVAPPIGFSYFFYGQRISDISTTESYVDALVAKSAAASNHNRVRVKNEGTAALTNIDVTMQISGANSFSQTINIATLAAGADQTVDFSAYNISNTGNQQVLFTAVVAGDERPENNTLIKQQTVSSSFVQPLSDTLNHQTGIGFNNLEDNEIAIKIYGTGTRKISQIRVPFVSYFSSISFKILEDDGADNAPGTVLHTSVARNTNFDNETIYNLLTPITVNGDYFISVLQNSLINMGWMFGFQYPLPPKRIYNGRFGNYEAATSDKGFHQLIKIVEENSLADVGIVAVTNPLCTYNSANPVTVSLRNYSSATHDFVANPVTISGSVINDKTNIATPFSILKNTGTLAAGAIEPITVLSSYDFNERTIHRFKATTTMTGDAEPKNDSLSYIIVNSLRHTKSFTDSVCPFTTVTLTAAANVYRNITWTGNILPSSGSTATLAPSVTSLVKVTATDYRGCTIIDSIEVPVRTIGLPPTPVINFNDTLLSFSNGFSDTLRASNLDGHSINWKGEGVVMNGGLEYVVSGFRGQNPEPHIAYYSNIATGCGSNPATITTRFATGLLMNNNNSETLCDTSFYDAGGAFNINQGSNNFTKTFLPATPGSKVKLSIYNISLGQFSTLRIYDGSTTNSPEIEQLDRFATNGLHEYIASNNEGAITVSFAASGSISSGWLAGITCEKPLQFRSTQNGLFTDVNNWESKLPTANSYSPARRKPSKGDDSIFIRHAIDLPANFSLPLDQTVIESTGTLTVPTTSTIALYSDNPGSELMVNGALSVDGNIYGIGSGFSRGNINLKGTLNLQGEIIIDSVVAIPAATAAIINATGSARISKLQINNPAGVTLNGNLDLSRGLDLKNGILNIASSNFIRLLSGESPVLTGGSSSSFVNGKLRWQTFGSDPIKFPVGKNGISRTIELLSNQNSSDFNVEYEAELFTGVPPNRTLPATFTNINQQWYHTVKITGGISNFSDATATIYYEATDGISNLADLRIGKDDGSTNWLDLGGTGTSTPDGSITSNSFTSFSDFVLANITGGVLPVTLLEFSGNLSNHTLQLNWKVTNEIRFAGYAIERSTDAITFTKIGFLNARGLSTANSYQYSDVQLPAGQQIFYRLKMIDQDGRFTYSNVLRIKLNGQINNRIITIAPNPFTNSIGIQMQSAANQNIQLQLLDMSGKLLQENRYAVLPGMNQLILQAGDLPKGMYLLKLLTTEGVITEKVIKQ